MAAEEDATKLFHPQQLAVLKVALAVAIIKNTPHGISAKEYTERLALQFTTLQKDWKEKAVDLEMQLLQMKHQLARLSLSDSSNSSMAAGDHASWQAFGCGTSNAEPSTSIEPPLSASVSSLTVDASPMCEVHRGDVQASVEVCTHKARAQQRHLLSNLHFLQNVSRLQVAGKLELPFQSSHEGSASPLDSSHHVVMETVTKALTGLASMCEDGGMVEGASQKDLQDVVELAIGLLQDTASDSVEKKELCAASKRLARVMVEQIPHRTWGKMTHWRKMCCSLLPLFSSNAALSEDIILDLLQLVHKGISNLHTSEEDVTSFDHTVVTAAGEGLSLLNHLLSSPKWPRTDKVNQELQNLKHCSYKLVASYPLFTYQIWKLDSVIMQ